MVRLRPNGVRYARERAQELCACTEKSWSPSSVGQLQPSVRDAGTCVAVALATRRIAAQVFSYSNWNSILPCLIGDCGVNEGELHYRYCRKEIDSFRCLVPNFESGSAARVALLLALDVGHHRSTLGGFVR